MATNKENKDSSSEQVNEVILEWSSPSRPFMKRGREYFRTVGAIIFLVSVVLIFVREFLLIGVLLALFFMLYVLSSVPPEKIRHKFTSLGVRSGGYFHRWEELFDFWFDEKYGQNMVVIRTHLNFPTHLQILLGNQSQEKVKQVLGAKIPFKEDVEPTFLDKASAWLGKNIPLEKTTSH